MNSANGRKAGPGESRLEAKRFEGPFPGVTIEIEHKGSVVMRSSENEKRGTS